MNTSRFGYADELMSFIDELLFRNISQFAVNWDEPTQEWVVSYPPDQPEFVTVGLAD